MSSLDKNAEVLDSTPSQSGGRQEMQLKPVAKVGQIISNIAPPKQSKLIFLQEQFDLELCLNFPPLEIDEASLRKLPDPKTWTEQLAIGIAEVLVGDRPAFQLIRYLAFDVYCSVERQAIKHQSDAKRVRPLLRCVQVSQLNETVVNASAVIQKGLRGRAMAMRLVAESDRWRCTELLVA